ncbi:antibiotic biosynthesis monooxygenase [Microbulbifer sp. OS29]|uniref:Antibiotic biosynthesis monooxygenase n=1 Tax=Microbulbifer okhotskensis TaxID=2926617 RepID=A0A9X2ENS7_9GAMM|nr:antibiotic biosynthesis monooxygenase family protein [Microbulbifer okhotskensis]MCO1332826.1 antibiotic biosynthesis monooxygenase [Microbulbifer okhotskensis]
MKYIFEIHLQEGYEAEDYADAWRRASEIIQRAPGALGTELHRKIDDPRILIAIASWRSKRDRDAMRAEDRIEVDRIIGSVAPFVKIKLIGEFYDPQWVVSCSNKQVY